jgi:hypothetical protein
MHTVIRLAAAIVVITAVVSGSTAFAKPERAAVRVEYEAPAPLRLGEEATTVLTVRALADLDRVVVTMAPFQGLDLISEPKEVTFTGLKAGNTRQVTVTIRLTDERAGYLGVSYRTHQGKTIAGGATTVIYRNAGA